MTKSQEAFLSSKQPWIKYPHDFIVRERISPRYLRRYEFCKNKVQIKSGKNILAVLAKINTTTADAIKLISKKLNIKKYEIGFAGLKDSYAVTEQYLTIPKNKFKPIHLKNIVLKKAGETDARLKPGDLRENEFFIKLTGVKIKSENLKKIRKGIPNYFGFQRFGAKQNNHLIGKKLIKGTYAVSNKQQAKFFVHAYQSYLFNKMLAEYEKKHRPLFMNVPVLGCNTLLKNNTIGRIYRKIMKKEALKLYDFCIKQMHMKCRGSERALFIKPKVLDCRKSGNNYFVHFILPKGSYATVVLRYLVEQN